MSSSPRSACRRGQPSWPARPAVYQWPFFRPDDVSTLGRGGSYMAHRYAAKIRGVPAADRAVTIGCRIKPGRPELIGAPRTAVTRPAVYRRPQADPVTGAQGEMTKGRRVGQGRKAERDSHGPQSIDVRRALTLLAGFTPRAQAPPHRTPPKVVFRNLRRIRVPRIKHAGGPAFFEAQVRPQPCRSF